MKSIKCLGMLAVGALLGLAGARPSPLEKRSPDIPTVGAKVRGVNLGGWLVLEPWITPSLFEDVPGAVDEYTFSEKLGKEAARAKLEEHWSTFFTAQDFVDMAAAGLNHVRIPVGYWAVKALPGDPYVRGQLPYLDKAIGWARKAGLKVWIDLHGAPGGQNGFDNSGYREHIEWQEGNNVEHTLKVIQALTERYAVPKCRDVVAAIGLLNEPLAPKLDQKRLEKFWNDGYNIVREINPTIPVVIADGFTHLHNLNGFMTNLKNVVLDTHQYQVFTMGQLQADIQGHLNNACEIGRQLQACDKPTITGEWSGAMTDCTYLLNGVGRGVRYEGTYNYDSESFFIGNCGARVSGSIAGLGSEEMEKTRRLVEAQLDAYEQGAGWFFWTWKTERGSPGWEMRDMIKTGVFPQPLTNRKYPNQCKF